MMPVDFPERTVLVAEKQDEYITLPAFQDKIETVSCWTFTLWERVRIFFGARLWLRQLNFGKSLQPQLPQIKRPFENDKSTPGTE